MARIDKLTNLLKLDKLLRNDKGMTIEEILCEIPDLDKRTFHNYISNLTKHYDAPLDIGRQDRYATYRYKNPGFSIQDQVMRELNISIQSIQEVLEHLDLMGGDDTHNAIIRLYLTGLKNNLLVDHKPFMAFDNNLDLTGIEHIEPLGEAIINRTPLRLRYKPFVEAEQEIIIHPYFLKQYNNRWFLLAWSETSKQIHNYPLDRIVDFEPATEVKYLPTNVDFTEYFDDIVGVTNFEGKEVKTVLLKINKHRFNYIRTKPLHWSQKEIKTMETKDSVFVTLKVKTNPELEKLLLSYGDSIEVIEPQSLRKEMRKIARKMAAHYDE